MYFFHLGMIALQKDCEELKTAMALSQPSSNDLNTSFDSGTGTSLSQVFKLNLTSLLLFFMTNE